MAIVDDLKNGPTKLDEEMSKAIGGICDALNHDTSSRLHFVSHQAVDLDPDDLGQRILFTLPWPVRASTSLMLDVKSEIIMKGERVVKEERVPLMVRLPALPIVENHNVAADLVRDRIVVIGGSNA